MSDIQAQIQATFGVSRSGKSYARVHWIMTRFLYEPWHGRLVTNLPLEVDLIAEKFQKEFEAGKHKISGDVVRDRIVVIPVEWRRQWMDQAKRDHRKLEVDDDGTPLHTPFRMIESLLPKEGNFHLLLDEVHNFYSDNVTKAWASEWQTFFDEVSHLHGTVEIMTQAAHKLPKELKSSAEVRRDVVGARNRRLPGWNILFNDFYNIRAAFTGVWRSKCWVLETVNNGSEYVPEKPYSLSIGPEGYKYYDSRNSPERAVESRKGEGHEAWEHLSRFGVIRWFVRRNIAKMIFAKGTLLILFCCFLAGGGVRWVMRGFISEVRALAKDSTSGMISTKSEATKTEQESDEAVPAAVSNPEVQPVVAPVVGVPPAPSKPVYIDVQLIDQNGVWIDGVYTETGGILPAGTRAGAAVQRIHYKRGIVHLDDDSVLRLQSNSGLNADNQLEGRVPRTQGAESTSRIRSGVGTDGNVQSGRAPAGRVRSISGAASRRVGSGRVGVGQSAGQSDRRQGAVVGRPGATQASGGNRLRDRR